MNGKRAGESKEKAKNEGEFGASAECAGMGPEERSEYLEGKLYVLARNAERSEREWRSERERLRSERAEMACRMEAMKKEVLQAKEELREARAENRVKRLREKASSDVPAAGEGAVFQSDGVKEKASEKGLPAEKAPNGQFGASSPSAELAPLKTLNEKPSLHPIPGAGNMRDSKHLPIEWILSHLKGEVLFDLSELTREKLKTFGRFFKREFDSLYSKRAVISEIDVSVKSTKHLVKSLLYLSDRPEIVTHFLPYVFMQHILPDGRLFIKEIVHILYRVGLAPFLQAQETVQEMAKFFAACSDSVELMHFLETLSRTSPRAVARVVSQEYMLRLSETHGEAALRIFKALEGCGAYAQSAHEAIHLHRGRVYVSPDESMHFFM
ncbi:uncharacterized protein NEMAJ01_0481 [Nematocida major]|uniref:uncharacterized protein n=1 Tax=Nematocida major TaxID=1912982 RepID=UPI0020075604|nr:uncharacterized protein NEMAJ01_0481 [Nematocida major]KAH9385585.1 hypothetical protein NEMAJ01_0481 [Nematocida major]